jgi:hypothetical protein
MTFQAGSKRCRHEFRSLRRHLKTAVGGLCLTVLPWATHGLAGAGFDAYASIDDGQSVMVQPEPAATYASSNHGDEWAPVPWDQPAQSCQQGHCGGCNHCQGSATKGTGILNRILGDACPRVTAQIDALMLWQSNVPSVPLLRLDDPANPALFFNANSLVSEMGIGPRAAIMLHVDQEYALEANYFNVGSINTTRPFEAPLPQQVVWDSLVNLPQFGNIDSGTIGLNGAIQSFELNWRHRHCGSPFTWLVGFRWVEWNEALTLNDSFSIPAPFPEAGNDLLNVQTGNDLYGAQLGFDALLLNLWEVIRFNSVVKAGVYGNNATASTFVSSDRFGFGPDRNFAATTNQTGFFGEVGVNGAVRLSDHFFWRAGYNFFWLAGVATTTQQLAVVDAAPVPAEGSITAGSSVFLHGVNTGLEFIW